MTRLDEIKDTLLLCSTHQQHPTQVDEANAALKVFGEKIIACGRVGRGDRRPYPL